MFPTRKRRESQCPRAASQRLICNSGQKSNWIKSIRDTGPEYGLLWDLLTVQIFLAFMVQNVSVHTVKNRHFV